MTHDLRRRCTLALTLLSLGVVLLSLPQVASAQEVGLLQGRLVNGTAGAGPVAGLDVFLHLGLESGEEQRLIAVSDAEGWFQFDQVSRSPTTRYALTAGYQEAIYRLDLPSPPSLDSVELRVFEATSQTSRLRQESGLLIVVQVDEAQHRVTIFEAALVSNTGDRTVVPDFTQMDQMGFLRFALPLGATELNVEAELSGGSVVQVDRGFGLTTPVPPGVYNLVFTYVVPYEGGALDLSRTFPFGAASFRILVPEKAARVEAPSLEALDPLVVAEVTYRQFSGGGLAPGASVSITLTGLPQPSWLQRGRTVLFEGPSLRAGVPVALALALAALVFYALVRRSREGAQVLQGVAGTGEAAAGQRQALIQAIAELDERFDRGELSEEEHRQRREELKARLVPPSVP